MMNTNTLPQGIEVKPGQPLVMLTSEVNGDVAVVIATSAKEAVDEVRMLHNLANQTQAPRSWMGGI